MTNRLLANPDKHVVVECNPTLVETLAKNRRINQCQFTLVQAALAYGGDTVSLRGALERLPKRSGSSTELRGEVGFAGVQARRWRDFWTRTELTRQST